MLLFFTNLFHHGIESCVTENISAFISAGPLTEGNYSAKRWQYFHGSYWIVVCKQCINYERSAKEQNIPPSPPPSFTPSLGGESNINSWRGFLKDNEYLVVPAIDSLGRSGILRSIFYSISIGRGAVAEFIHEVLIAGSAELGRGHWDVSLEFVDL